jgi:hypothetical protein
MTRQQTPPSLIAFTHFSPSPGVLTAIIVPAPSGLTAIIVPSPSGLAAIKPPPVPPPRRPFFRPSPPPAAPPPLVRDVLLVRFRHVLDLLLVPPLVPQLPPERRRPADALVEFRRLLVPQFATAAGAAVALHYRYVPSGY